jgi:hypothetical protein
VHHDEGEGANLHHEGEHHGHDVTVRFLSDLFYLFLCVFVCDYLYLSVFYSGLLDFGLRRVF